MEGLEEHPRSGLKMLMRRASGLLCAVVIAMAGRVSVARADHEIVVDPDQQGIELEIQVPGMAGDGNGNYGTDEGVNLDPCRWVYDPTGGAGEFWDALPEEWPTEAQMEDPGVRWYYKWCTDATPVDVTWVPVGEPAPGLPPPAPAQLAALARKYLPVPEPEVRTNPEGEAVTNLPTWLWLTNSAWGARTGRLSLRGVSVTVVATPVYVDWNTGAGKKRCNGQGRAYHTDQPPEGQSTYCSWTYKESSAKQPGAVYRGTATSTWRIHWISSGVMGEQQGDLPPLTRTSSFELRVAEIQAVVTK